MVLVKENDLMVFGNKRKERTGINQRWIIMYVHRISNRLGLVKTKTPEETEFALMEKIPKKYWLDVNDTFVMYGQNICKPISPMCEVCKIRNGCKYYKTNSAS